jgi:RNA polymerase sigma-70 factor (ECF subfamily)
MTEKDQKEQFIEVLEKNIGIVLKISGIYARTAQDREDLVNDITLELWRSFGRFRGDSKISTWIYRVALNVSMNFSRKRNNDRLYFPSDLTKIEVQGGITDAADSTPSDILYQCIDELDQFNKAIILLYLDGNSHDEISVITGISKTNVGTRLSRIREQIRKIAVTKNLN